jgi:tyrosinase
MRVRRDVWKLAAWDPVLEWYAKAVADLQSRPISDPTSWRYQAAIHDYVRAHDPNASPGESLPRNHKRFWRQCQHHSWFFLPWHRMYLACFEQIVAASVSKLGGPETWALPYWNYSDSKNTNARKLPPAFYAKTLPGGERNPLRVDQRAPDCNLGEEIADNTEVDLSHCLVEPRFAADPAGGSVGFGGPETKFNHRDGAVGGVERLPHNSIHGAVGGDKGWMGAFETAALDPLFWLHHANIDRLWEVWRLRDSSHSDPTGKTWSTLKFEFHDSGGRIIKFAASEVVDAMVASLGYRYEDVSDPIPAAVKKAAPTGAFMAEKSLPEMVGATERPIRVAHIATTAVLAVTDPTGPAGVARETGAASRRAFLNIENVTGTGATTYRVYLNLPPGADSHQHEDLFAGIVPTFGVREASRRDKEHSGSGLHYSLDVTAVIERLSERPDWDPKSLRVTFVPKRVVAGAAEIQIGRVSLYYV